MGFYNELTAEQRQAFLDHVRLEASRSDTFSQANGMRITLLEEGRAEGELTVTERNLNTWGIVHGGCLATLADAVAGNLMIAHGHKCVTLSCNLNYLRPARGSLIRCVALPQKIGRTTSVASVSMTDQQGQEVASGIYTFFSIGPLNYQDVEQGLKKKP